MKFAVHHRLLWPSIVLPTLGFFLASLGYHDWMHLGAEYNEIGLAIYKGRGFSDPFGIETGPTAWMPPVLPLMLAAGYWIFDGDATMVMRGFLAFQWFAIASSIALLLHQAIRLDRYGLGIAIAVTGLAIHFDLLFCVTHDHALLLLLVNLQFVVLSRGCRQLSAWSAAGQGLLGGFLALCNPVLATVWASWIVVTSKSIRTVMIAGVVSVLVITPWTIRNYVHFGRLIPIKSAAKFELHQALCVSRDGVVGPACFWQHPWGRDNAARREYASVGEQAFIDARGAPAAAKWREAPMDCVDRLINRFVTATLWSETPGYVGVPTIAVVLNRLFYGWPFVSLVLLVIVGQVRTGTGVVSGVGKSWQIAALIYAGVLVPYIGVSYYARYAGPLFAIKCLLVLYLVHVCLCKIRPVEPGVVSGGEFEGDAW